MKHKHNIKTIGTKDCEDCKVYEEVRLKKDQQIKSLNQKNKELQKHKVEVEISRKTISDNVELMNVILTERDTLKAMITVESNNIEGKAAEKITEEEIPEFCPNKCQKCSFNTNSLDELRKHAETKHKVGFACPVCQKTFVFKTDLNKHKRTVHNKATHVCNICQGNFLTYQGLKDHKQKRCKTKATDAAVKQRSEVKHVELKYQKCNYVTNSQSNFINHIASHSDMNKFSCDTCKAGFKDKTSLFRHIFKKHVNLSVTKVWKCTVCETAFESKKNLIDHQISKHSSPDSHHISTCSFCQFKFKGLGERDAHICEMHPYKSTDEQKRIIRRKNTECRSCASCERNAWGKCWFQHSEQQEWLPRETCNKCDYTTNSHNEMTFHTDTVHQHSEEQNNSQQAEQDTRPTLWCSFQERCTKRACKFRHFNFNQGYMNSSFQEGY